MDSTTSMVNLSDNQLSIISRTADLPSGYKGKEGNVLLAYEFSQRKGLPLLHVMQNMHFIQGTPSWKSEYQRAMLNRSGYIIPPIEYKWNPDHTACRAAVTLKSNGHILEGPEVSLEMADKDGWSKNSKWKTIPEVMLMNRASTFLIRYYFPDVLDGIISTDEAEDIAASETPQMQYEDKTEPEPEPVKVKSPRVKLSERALSECGGDREAATKLCVESLNRVGISSSELTEENLPKAVQAMIGILAEAATMPKPETETEAETDDAPF